MKFQTPRGTRDFLPEAMMKRHFVIDTARTVFENWGFDPLDTPAFEEYALLTAKSGEAIKDEIYHFKDKSDRDLGLRFDFTVPLARVVVNNPDIPKPFRRYQLGPVWRYDRPGSGRYREFWQADVDIVGAEGASADAEVVACACDALRKMGMSNFYVRVNNRKIINAFLGSLNLVAPDILRSIDKLEKIGDDAVKEELKEKGVGSDEIEAVMDFVKGTIKDAGDILDDKKGIEELKEMVSILESFQIPVKIDLSMVRGLDYYTGNIFEINQEGSLTITAGGRYDKMIEGFGGRPTSATGISLGVDRLINLVQLEFGKTKTHVYLANVKSKEKVLEIAKQLREIGINSEYDVMGRSLSKQLEYVNSKGIKFLIVVGEKEISSGVVKIRNMFNGNEKDIELRNLQRIRDLVDE